MLSLALPVALQKTLLKVTVGSRVSLVLPAPAEDGSGATVGSRLSLALPAALQKTWLKATDQGYRWFPRRPCRRWLRVRHGALIRMLG